MAKPYNHRRAENEYKKCKEKIESQNTIKKQRLSDGSTMIIKMRKDMMSQIT